MNRLLSVTVLLLGVLALTVPPAQAQDEKTLKKAARRLGPDKPEEDNRAAFQALSDALRSAPNLATPRGWWLRGEAASWLTLGDTTGLGTAEVAVDSFREAAKAGIVDPDLAGLRALEGELTRRAERHKGANPLEAREAYRAALLLIEADRVRQTLDLSKPVDRVRRMALATEAALSAQEVRRARQLFLDLESQGGFIEPLAMAVVTQVEAQESAGIAFKFLGDLRAKHPNNRALLAATTDLCLQYGWIDEARRAMTAAEPYYEDTYEDHMLLGGYRDALGDHDQAIARYRNALEHAPRAYDANWLLASLLVRLADAEADPLVASPMRLEARTALATVLESNPDNTDALRLFVETSDLEGQEVSPEVRARYEAKFPSAVEAEEVPLQSKASKASEATEE